MAKLKKDVRVCVEIDDQLSKILSIQERKNDDLIITIKSATNMREAGTNEIGNPIHQQRISIHRSTKSEDINFIIQTLEEIIDGSAQETKLDYTGEPARPTQATQAIKKLNNYAVLYCAKSPNLFTDRYKVEPHEKNIILTKLNKELSFYYIVAVCAPNTQRIKRTKDVFLRYFDFTYFSIVILWSLHPVKPFAHGVKLHLLTIKPDMFPEKYHSQLIDSHGFTPNNLIKMFKVYREACKDEFKNFYANGINTYKSENFLEKITNQEYLHMNKIFNQKFLTLK